MSVLVKYLIILLIILVLNGELLVILLQNLHSALLALYFPQHKFAYLVTSWQYSKPFLRSMMRQEHNKSLTIMFLLFFCLLVDKKSLLCNSFDYLALLPHLFSSTMTQKTALLCHYNLSLNASNGQ